MTRSSSGSSKYAYITLLLPLPLSRSSLSLYSSDYQLTYIPDLPRHPNPLFHLRHGHQNLPPPPLLPHLLSGDMVPAPAPRRLRRLRALLPHRRLRRHLRMHARGLLLEPHYRGRALHRPNGLLPVERGSQPVDRFRGARLNNADDLAAQPRNPSKDLTVFHLPARPLRVRGLHHPGDRVQRGQKLRHHLHDRATLDLDHHRAIHGDHLRLPPHFTPLIRPATQLRALAPRAVQAIEPILLRPHE